MYISNVQINGFRNFNQANINFKKKTLIIGSNDIGKSNLIYALRLLLDKKLSESDLELKDSDFHVYDEENNVIYIRIKFENVVEDCVIGKIGKYVNDQGEFYLAYEVKRGSSGEKSYQFYIGHDESDLQPIESRYYLKVLNMDYIESSRELHSYIRKEKKNLLLESRKQRSEETVQSDDKITKKIEKSIHLLNRRITKLSYINNATNSLNDELLNLSFHHISNTIDFDAGGTGVDDFINNVTLVSKVNGKSLAVGGDGRNNQIYLALRTAKNRISDDTPLEVTFCCIEEPEAHLHPHQQRRLSKYLVESLKSQVLITSHSPQIACEFSPDSIVRLYNQADSSTKAANDGCNTGLEKSMLEFGYRLNIVPADAFYSNVVLLVEGPSEVLFYKALATDLEIDIDKYNISILMVDGVGFEPFIDVLSSLSINWVVRTDNDIIKVPYKDYHYYAGISRCLKIYEAYCNNDETINQLIKEKKNLLTNINSRENLTESEVEVGQEFVAALECHNMYLSEIDLENDILNSPLRSQVETYYGENNYDNLLNKMQKSKATFMYDFLYKNQGKLKGLLTDNLSSPLIRCKEIVEELFDESHTRTKTDN
ncbi:ATP-dependent endonuclease [Brevibacillus sp. HB2.2]|uniref:ATP-dependent nuclease n=1 Tax=Brevibacillus sp. HB2.2 TaxID=2738846 RepID=UPI00156B3023|nr:AAA family ATPase [Brevibacillus sp. HB2.2]NRS46656.1 AAA family ATPase [Brevibacillus sp. HB2.2]